MDLVLRRIKDRRKWKPPEPPDVRVSIFLMMLSIIAASYWDSLGLLSTLLPYGLLTSGQTLLFLYLFRPFVVSHPAARVALVAGGVLLFGPYTSWVWSGILGQRFMSVGVGDEKQWNIFRVLLLSFSLVLAINDVLARL